MKKIILFYIIIVVVSVLGGYVYANELDEDKKIQEEMRQMQERDAKMRAADMERMKKEDPELYAKISANQVLQDQVSQIAVKYRENKMSYDQAKAQMRPLMTKLLQGKIQGLDNQIAGMRKKLAQLEAAKANNSLLIDNEIDTRLGKIEPSDDMMF